MDLYKLHKEQWYLEHLTTKMYALFRSMDWDTMTEPEKELISFITRIISLAKSLDLDKQTKPVSKLIKLITESISYVDAMGVESESFEPESDPDPDFELIKLIIEIIPLVNSMASESERISLITHIISLVKSMVWGLQLKPEPELGSLIVQIFPLVRSMVSDSQPESELISQISQIISLVTYMDLQPKRDYKAERLVTELERISLSPQVEVQLEEGKFHVKGEVRKRDDPDGNCYVSDGVKVSDLFNFTRGKDIVSHIRCVACNGEKHEEYDKAPVEVKHTFHPRHFLQLVRRAETSTSREERECNCCDEDLASIFYYCPPCDYALNLACVEKAVVLSVDHPKWHEHKLSLFPRHASLICDLCALADPSCPFYVCPPCDFVVHQSCTSLPRVIRISRHLHRISFTPYFDKGNWFCGVCRRKIDNDYGGYSCIKDGCSYAAHSRCATQSNVWDGVELEGVPEENEEEQLQSFKRISDGIIQHFSHQHHHLRINEDTGRDYDENKRCQACIIPIDSGNYYSCLECDFILHEICANLPRKLLHPIHPHMLTLVGKCDRFIERPNLCVACHCLCTGFYYKSSKEDCYRFRLHVQCATILEPLVHGSHMHPLFLTSKPGEWRSCSVCKDSAYADTETFNCIECDFAMCFACATLPQKVKYKHDKHMLTLSYGEETCIETYWCEVCERKLNPKKRWFYRCNEYCCVTLHIECLLGKDKYMKLGSMILFQRRWTNVLRNNQKCRPICVVCNERCQQYIVFSRHGSITCSLDCFHKMSLILVE